MPLENIDFQPQVKHFMFYIFINFIAGLQFFDLIT